MDKIPDFTFEKPKRFKFLNINNPFIDIEVVVYMDKTNFLTIEVKKKELANPQIKEENINKEDLKKK